jgi:hypothetical protein
MTASKGRASSGRGPFDSSSGREGEVDPQGNGDGSAPPDAADSGGGGRPGRLRSVAVRHGAAFVLFAAVWLLAMGPRILGDMDDRMLSSVPREASVFIWSLQWWAHGWGFSSNPLLSPIVWAPTGLNLGWVATSPGPVLLAAPITLAAGPIVAFNVLTLITPPLTAWTAYLLAYRLTRVFPAALLAGFLFGFSPDVMREIESGHLNLSMLFLLPIAVYLVVRRFEGSLSPRAFVVLLALVIVAQFSIFIETVATLAVVGAFVGGAAVLMAPKSARRHILETAGMVALSFVLAALIVSPYLFTIIAYPRAEKPSFQGLASGASEPNDLLRLVIPRRGVALGPPVQFGLQPDINYWYFGFPLLAALVT